MGELVSVIIPSYNHEKFIADCILSICEQTYNNIEIIIIDDCSKDETFEIAEKILSHPVIKKRFTEIILKKKIKNSGAHHSINLGLSLAKGEFISIINSDDLYHRDRLSIMIEEMKSKGSDFAFSLIKVFYKELEREDFPRELPTPHNIYSFPLLQLALAEDEPSIGFALLRMNIAGSTGNFIFRRNLLSAVKGFSSLKYCHDLDFILRSLLFTEPLFVKEPLYYYRLHEINTFRSVQHLALVETEITFRRFFRAINMIKPVNVLCPSPENWPGYFEFFLKRQNLWSYWIRESGGKEPYWRVYDKEEKPEDSFVEVLRRLYGKLKEEAYSFDH